MTDTQSVLWDLLKEFDGFCQKHSLRYFLAGGTLLGAIRHRGFIPWDDDIDVIMPEADYIRLIGLSSSMPPFLSFICDEKDEKYPFLFGKLFFKSDKKMQYLDIFPVCMSASPNWWSTRCFAVIQAIGYVLQVKTGWTDYIPYKRLHARLGYAAASRLSCRQLKSLRRFFVRILRRKNSAFCFSPGGAYKADKEFYKTEWLLSSLKADFESEKFPIPFGWNHYLTQMYGNYMKIPTLHN